MVVSLGSCCIAVNERFDCSRFGKTGDKKSVGRGFMLEFKLGSMWKGIRNIMKKGEVFWIVFQGLEQSLFLVKVGLGRGFQNYCVLTGHPKWGLRGVEAGESCFDGNVRRHVEATFLEASLDRQGVGVFRLFYIVDGKALRAHSS